LSVWDTTPADKIGYGEAVRWNGLVGHFGLWLLFDSILFGKVEQKHGAKMVHLDAFIRSCFSFILPVIQLFFLFMDIMDGIRRGIHF
jgi:maltose/moltooligosaccharide transporter